MEGLLPQRQAGVHVLRAAAAFAGVDLRNDDSDDATAPRQLRTPLQRRSRSVSDESATARNARGTSGTLQHCLIRPAGDANLDDSALSRVRSADCVQPTLTAHSIATERAKSGDFARIRSVLPYIRNVLMLLVKRLEPA